MYIYIASVASYVKYSYILLFSCFYYFLLLFFCMYFLFDDVVTETNIIHMCICRIKFLSSSQRLSLENRKKCVKKIHGEGSLHNEAMRP